MDELSASLERLKGRWMTGGGAVEQAPADWRALTDGVDPLEAELRLVALAGQALEIALRPAPPPSLAERPPLPTLAAPSLPEAARPRFRRLLASAAKAPARRDSLLRFLAARSYAAHPADWTPAPGDETAPALYAPWLTWMSAAPGQDGEAELTEESWADFAPAERRAVLARMRRADPAAARALIEAKAPAEAADQRLRLVQLLETGLSAEDAPFLEGLAKDRSEKIRDLAADLLARLGQAARTGALDDELAELMTLKPAGMLRRTTTLTATRAKNDAQRRRRDTLFAMASTAGLAAALEIEPEAMLAAWDLAAEPRATAGFVAMVARTAPDALLPAFAERLAEAARPTVGLIAELAPRLDAERRAALALRMLEEGQAEFEEIAAVSGEMIGGLPLEAIEASAAYDGLHAALAQIAAEEPSAARTRRETAVGETLFELGLLAEQPAAAALIPVLAASGLMAVDPRLDMLQLNAALPQREDAAE